MPRLLPSLTFGLSLLVMVGVIATYGASTSGSADPTDQLRILAVIFNALAPMLSPISSAVGAPVTMPIAGESLYLGLLPLLGWVIAGIGVGLASRDFGEAAGASMALASLVYVLWLGLTLLILPRVESAISWVVYLAQVATRLLFDSPLDFASLYLLPITLSTATTMLHSRASRPKIREQPPVRRRFWEY